MWKISGGGGGGIQCKSWIFFLFTTIIFFDQKTWEKKQSEAIAWFSWVQFYVELNGNEFGRESPTELWLACWCKEYLLSAAKTEKYVTLHYFLEFTCPGSKVCSQTPRFFAQHDEVNMCYFGSNWEPVDSSRFSTEMYAQQKTNMEIKTWWFAHTHHQFTLPETNSSPLKIGHPKRKLVFQPSIFRGHVSFREGRCSQSDLPQRLYHQGGPMTPWRALVTIIIQLFRMYLAAMKMLTKGSVGSFTGTRCEVRIDLVGGFNPSEKY